MKEKITPYLRGLLHFESMGRQYLKDKNEGEHFDDPLMEEAHERVRGLVHKYPNRALIKVSYLCAAHCRFCTRIRQIGNKEGTLSDDDIENIALYLQLHPEIDDVILSGGDPFYTPRITQKLLNRLAQIESIKVFRIGTRMPLQSPDSFQTKPLQALIQYLVTLADRLPVYVLIHVEHPDELTDAVVDLLRKWRKHPFTLLSQTVFLKGINDEFDILYPLFKQLYHLGVTPYYLYHCDKVAGLERFVGDMEKEKKIALQLRESLSGIACPLFVEDIANGYGKWPVV